MMGKRTNNSREWAMSTNAVQVIETKQAAAVLKCPCRSTIDNKGHINIGKTKDRSLPPFSNLGELIMVSGYQCNDIVKDSFFTTATTEFFSAFGDRYLEWIAKNKLQPISAPPALTE